MVVSFNQWIVLLSCYRVLILIPFNLYLMPTPGDLSTKARVFYVDY
jgi:hypothetical protein